MILVRESSRLIILGAILAAALLLGSPAPSDAAEIVLVSNTGQRAYGGTPVGAYDHAQGFTTGKNTLGYVLTSIELQVHTAPANGTLTVSVREADEQDPSDTVLYTLTNPGDLGTGLRKFTAPANSTLNAETTYFVHMTFAVGGNPTQPQWGLTDRTTEDSGAYDGWSIANVRHSRLTGSSVTWSNGTDARIKIKVKGENRAPAAPVNLSATVGNGQVTLSWNDPDNDTITKYQYNTAVGATFNDIAGSGATTTTYTVTGQTNGTQYTFAVRAVNDGGDGAASTVDVLMMPAAPANLMATPDDGQVVLSWDDPGNTTITKYQYSTDSGTNFTDIALNVIDSSETGKFKYTIENLTNGETYTFTLRAVNSTGNGGESTLTVAMVPPAPTGLTTTGGDRQVALSWNDPNDTGITGYQYSTDDGANYTAFAVAAIDPGETGKFKYTIKNLPNGVTYNLALRAVNASGNGGVATETALMVPAAPASLSAMPLDMMAQLTWDAPSNNDTITSYKYSTDDGATFTAISGSGADTTGYTVTSLTNGVTYTFKVRAVNNSGDGPASTAATATPMPVPAAPTGLKAIGGNGQVTLSWDDPNDTGITGYQYSTDGGTNYTAFALTDIDDINENTFGYTVTGLTNGVTHTLALRAVNAFGNGMPSTVTALMVPAAPELSAAAGDEEVALSWADPGNATITRYEYSTDDGDWADISGSDDTTTSHTVAGLTNYQAYSFQIRAVNETGIGPASNSASATPRIGKPAKPASLTAKAGDARVTLNWADPNKDTISGYQIAEVVPEYFLTDGAAGDHFGISVAIDGDTAVVGADRANNKKGSAYIFTRDSVSGVWTQQAKLEGENEGDQFGWAVAVDGDTVVVGAHALDVGDETNSGAVYVFTKSGSTWIQAAKLTPTVPEAYAFFGGSVALDGNTLVIGSRLYDTGGYLNAGAAYVFTKSGSTWSKQAKLTASIPRQLAALGYSLAVDGDTVLVGAFGDDTIRGELGSGSAYVFEKPSEGWDDDDYSGNETAKLTASDRQPSGYFGFSVALDGDTAVIGARQHSDPITGAGSGAAYVFARESGGWGEKAKLTSSDAAAGDNFGVSVAVEEDTVVVGSWQDDDNGRNSGSAYVFEKPASGWARTFETLKLTAPDGAANDRFGWSVAVDLDDARGDLALVGAYSDDHDVGDDGSIEINAGSVHVLGIPDWRDITGSGKSTVSHIEQGLTNGDEYTFQIRALNQSGAGPASDAASATPLGVPAAPTLTAATGDTQVTLSWTKHVPTDPITIAPITRYEYSIDDGSTFIEIALSDIDDSDATDLAYTVTGLDNLTTYTFQILAVNAIGETASNTHDATPASATPDAPANLLANPGDTQVRLTWEDPGDSSIDKYQYRWKEGTQVTLFDAQDEWRDVPNSNANTTRYTVTGLSNGTSYAFQVRAWDDEAETKGSEPAQISAEPFSATPAAPTGLMADPDDSLVALTWDDPDDSTIDRYEYRQKVEDPSNPNEFGDWMPITSSGPTTTEYTVTDLVNGTEYTFEVRAVDVHNGTEDEGDPSADRATPLPPVPGKPTILSVAERNQEVTLSWQAPPGSVVETYEVLQLQASALVNPGVVVDDKFGYSVAVDGDIAVVGAYRDDNNGADSGAAYVFTRSGGVEWDQGVKLTASDGAAYDNFGISVAVDGDTLVVGAPGDDDNGADSGSVYVFTRDPDSGEWRQGAKLTPDDGQALDYFGYSVAVSGDTVLVGAYQDDEDNDLEDSGSAYVFVKPNSEGGWDDWDDLPQTNDDDEVEDQDDLTAKLTASDAADDAYFGTSVALDSDTAVIGAPGDDDDGIDSGSVYVFVRPSGGWAGWGTLSATEKLGLTTKLTAGADGGAGDALGISVALDVETVLEDSVEVEVTTVVVGAYLDDREDDATTEVDETAIDAGSAYVFTNSAVMWDDGVKLPPSDGEAGDYFGYSVAVDVDTVVVGAYGDDENGSESGSAYVFTRDPSDASWVQANKLYAENGEAGGRFGYGVAVDAASNTALVGAGSAHVLDIHDWEEVEGGSGARSHTFAMLTNEREYDFQVRAVNLAGAGDEAKAEVELQGPGGGGGSAVRPERDKAPVNNAPRFTEGDVTSRTVPEDSEIGRAVGSPLSATDSDGDPLQYSLFGDGQTYFQVDPATGQLMTTASLDYEAQSEYSVQVTVNDDNGGRDVINLTIAVLDVDEPPSQPGAPQVSSAGLNGLNVSWTAPDNQGPEITDYDVRYREAGGEFQDAGHDGTGTSATLNDLSPESGYEVQVRAVNAEGTSPWSESGQGETEGALPAPVPTATPTPTPTQTPVPSTTPTPVPTPDAGATGATPVPTPDAGATGATPVPTPDAGATGATPVPTPVQTQVPLTAITKLSRTALAFRPPTLTPSPATAPTVPPRPTPPSLAMLSPTVDPTPAPPPAAPLTAPADEGGFSFNFNLWWILLILLLVVAMILTARLYTVMRRR